MRLFRWLFGRRSGSWAGRIKISPEYLPPELHYIIPLAELHGSDARVILFDRRLWRRVTHAEKLSAADIDSLRHLYTEIIAKGHGILINRWHDGHSRNKSCPPETTWPIYGLLCLFSQLGELGIAPFTDGAVRPMEFHEELDWNKLPASLRYLAGNAEVYGSYQFENKIMEFLESSMTDKERTELQVLSEQMGRDHEAIELWLDDFPMTQHREAALADSTGHLVGLGEDAGLL